MEARPLCAEFALPVLADDDLLVVVELVYGVLLVVEDPT